MCDSLRRDHANIVNEAFQKLEQIHLPPNAAMVFDIDETLLDLSGNPIEPVVNLYNMVKSKGITPIIITARFGHERNTELTRNQLIRAGITGWRFIYFLPPHKNDVSLYKQISRQDAHDRGYHVVMSIGDEPYDIGYAGGHGFVVPKMRGC